MPRFVRLGLVAIALVALAAVITFLEVGSEPATNAPRTAPATADPDQTSGISRKDLPGVTAWLNGEPLDSLDDLLGRVVLIDFWTYTCVNCIRTLPYLRAWRDAYADKGFVIVGVHSPEFTFEKSLENVQRATEDLDVPWLVANDPERATRDAFQVRAWPTKILLGADGRERKRVVGEGQYEELEELIRLALVEAGHDVSGPLVASDPDLGLYRGITREVLAGWRFEFLTTLPFLGNSDGAPFEEANEFTDPGPSRPDGIYYLAGVWEWMREAVRHARTTATYGDYVAVSYSGRVANAVVRPDAPIAEMRVLVTLDGLALTEANRGRDVEIQGGNSYLVVQAPRLYEIVAAETVARHELRLHPLEDGFALHAFTFGP